MPNSSKTGGVDLTVFKTLSALIEHLKAVSSPIRLLDSFSFGLVLGRDGRKCLLSEAKYRARQFQHHSGPYGIQNHLKQAYQLKERLEATPGLSHVALARELGVSRFGLIQTLSLAKLSPEIQRFILALPPGMGERKVAGILSKEKLWHLTGMSDFQEQNGQFEKSFSPRDATFYPLWEKLLCASGFLRV
ncbi:MAG: hypothetical protein HY402_05430 [Elusimicrobia bacterium]|nr:hypothetical protein [Elusimicrobiota bacterium]